jgi:putative DNA primase/helicase
MTPRRERPAPSEAQPAVGPSTRGAPLEPEHLTDLGNARRLVRLFGNTTICYVPPWKTWLVWVGTHWQRDETGEVDRLAKAVVAGIYAEAGYEQDRGRREELGKHAVRSESVRAIQAMITLAQTEAGIPVLPEQLDCDPWVLNVANGTLDLQTGALRPHRREDLLTKLIPVEFDAAAPCPTWLRFLERIFTGRPQLVAFLQRALGYALTGDTREQCFFVFYGQGNNGKSTLIETTATLLDAYAQRIAIETLLAKRVGDTVAMNDLFTIMGARFVSAVEPDMGRRLAEALVKALTGGDTIKAKKLYADLLSYKPAFKLFLATNHKPVIRGTDWAIWRRVRLVPFEVVIPDAEQDRALPEKLRGEQTGILAWAVQGCLAWQREGLGTPEEVRVATAAYRSDMDSLGEFLAECCVLDRDTWITVAELYAAYADWAKQGGEPMLSKRALSLRLSERGLTAAKVQHQRCWLGIRRRKPLDEETTSGTQGTDGDVGSSKPPSRARIEDFLPDVSRSVPSVPQEDLPGWVTETEEDGR